MNYLNKILTKIKSVNTNLFVGACALFISTCALFISTQEIRIMRVQQKASMYPYLSISKIYNANGFGFTLKNSGNGLAKINSYQVFNDSVFFRSWFDVIKTNIPNSKIDYSMVKTAGNIKDEMLTPNEKVNLIFFKWSPETRAFEKHFNNLKIKICYSSLLNENWIVSNNKSRSQVDNCKLEIEKEFGI